MVVVDGKKEKRRDRWRKMGRGMDSLFSSNRLENKCLGSWIIKLSRTFDEIEKNFYKSTRISSRGNRKVDEIKNIFSWSRFICPPHSNANKGKLIFRIIEIWSKHF